MAGQCACPKGLIECDGACTDTASDPANCGSCGNACAAGKVCLQGGCAAGCGALAQCGSACVDTSTNVLNCGACDHACAFGASCEAGTCSCPSGTSECGGNCIGTSTDPNNCGACGRVCSGGASCVSASCECPSGQTACSGRCVDTASDAANCGACGKACPSGQSCSAGACSCPGVTSASFARDVQPIFSASCAVSGCHSGTAPKQGLSLVAGSAYGELVGVASSECGSSRKRVSPGDPAASYLMNKLLGVDLCSGSQMPKSGQSLAKSELDLISGWICAGAPDN